MQQALHIPVMLREVLAAMCPSPGNVVVDATFGAGGYTRALLEAGCKVVAIDRDPNVELLAEALAREFPGQLFFAKGCFGDMAQLVVQKGFAQVQGVVMDLGVSSMQLDQAERGFSFNKDAPLDMRMGDQLLDAKHVVNSYSEQELVRILKEYGEERFARKIAKHLVAKREEAPIETTKGLADLVQACVPKGREKLHPATRSFQAIRIEVNGELDELARALRAAETLLVPAGRLVVVSFHSLEDRIVKQFFKERSAETQAVSRHDPRGVGFAGVLQPAFYWPRPRKVHPSEQEVRSNPRARSAILRMAERLPLLGQEGGVHA